LRWGGVEGAICGRSSGKNVGGKLQCKMVCGICTVGFVQTQPYKQHIYTKHYIKQKLFS
jgi:hypothetical protein